MCGFLAEVERHRGSVPNNAFGLPYTTTVVDVVAVIRQQRVALD